MRLADVVGHDAAVTHLARAAESGRVAGAYLLVGPTGIGKRALADAFAARLLCATPGGGDACGRCGECTRVAAGTHPDLRIVARDSDRRDIRIEQARDLIRWLVLRPMTAPRKVALIDGAEYLNDHGQNALLKTLEEPPGSAVLILVAAAPSMLLPTVRSRCQRVRLDPLPREVVERLLRARDVPPERARVLAAQSGGSVGRALELADDAYVHVRTRVLEELLRLRERTAADLSAAAQELGKGAVDAALAVCTSWYRDVLGRTLTSGALVNPDYAAAIEHAARETSPPRALRQLELVCDTIRDVERNANRVLAIETLLLALREIERGGRSYVAWAS
ncbi:MAG: DNA polymerase III subunit delta' [Candidatus Binatia bacterium]